MSKTGRRKAAPELTFPQHVADYLVREHGYGVLEQSDITEHQCLTQKHGDTTVCFQRVAV